MKLYVNEATQRAFLADVHAQVVELEGVKKLEHYPKIPTDLGQGRVIVHFRFGFVAFEDFEKIPRNHPLMQRPSIASLTVAQ